MKNHQDNATRAVLRPSLLAGAIGMALAAGSVHAIDLSGPNYSLNIDTTVSYSTALRVADRDDDNVGKETFNPAVITLPIEQQVQAPGRFSNNSDDGNLNFDSGEVIFNQARITSEMEFSYKNYGMFLRGNFFHDFKLNNKDALSNEAKDIAGQRARMLDAYAYGNFDLNGKQASIRVAVRS